MYSGLTPEAAGAAELPPLPSAFPRGAQAGTEPKVMNPLPSGGRNKETTAVRPRSLGTSVSNAASVESLKLFDWGMG